MKAFFCKALVTLTMAALLTGCLAAPKKEAARNDPALLALSGASVEVNRRQFRRAAGDLARGVPGVLPSHPLSELSIPYRMDFGWTGPSGEAVRNIAASLGWEGFVGQGAGLGMVSIAADQRGQRVVELLFNLNSQLATQGEEIEVDEIMRRLTIKRRVR
jgi:hypothetical protein